MKNQYRSACETTETVVIDDWFELTIHMNQKKVGDDRETRCYRYSPGSIKSQTAKHNAKETDSLNELVNVIKNQNKILLKQVALLTEENNRQKECTKLAKEAEKQAQREELRSRVFNWVTFGVATAISLVSLIISIVFC